MGEVIDQLAKMYYGYLEEHLLKTERVFPSEFEERIWKEIKENVEYLWTKVSETKDVKVADSYTIWSRVDDLAQDWIDVENYTQEFLDHYYPIKNYPKKDLEKSGYSVKNLLNLPKSLNTGLYSQYMIER